jgi:adenylate cyclase
VPPERVDRKLAAILAADVAGYSRLIGADEEGTLKRLKAHRKELIDPKLAEHQGRVVKLTGDGILIEFASAVAALRCAVEVQRAAAERNASEAADRRIEFRVGIHQGDIVVEDGDIFGDGVNVAARLEALAEPGGICVSQRIHEDAVGKVDVIFEDMGEQQLKNIARPVRVYRVRPDGPAAHPALTLPEKPSIAVLPFDNMSPGEALAELCLGLPESVITALSRIRWLSVAARNSSFAAAEAGRNLSKLAGQLGVRYLLEGSIQKRGPRLRATAQLIDARDGNHLWAQRYDDISDDLFALQDELTQKIVASVEQTLVAEIVRSSAHANDFSEAPLRRANRLHRSLERQDNADAQQLLRHLIALPSASVAAYQLLANTLELTIDCLWAEDPAAAATEALAASQKAVQLAPLDYLSHYALGRALLHSGRHDLAIAAARRSVELNPNSGTSLGGLGGVLAFAGNPEEASAVSERGFQLSPPEPYTALWIWYAAVAAFRLQQFETALRHSETGILVKPDVATGHVLRAIACWGLSRLSDATVSVQEAKKWTQSLSLASIPKYMPYRHRADLEKTIEALRQVGLPDQ